MADRERHDPHVRAQPSRWDAAGASSAETTGFYECCAPAFLSTAGTLSVRTFGWGRLGGHRLGRDRGQVEHGDRWRVDGHKRAMASLSAMGVRLGTGLGSGAGDLGDGEAGAGL